MDREESIKETRLDGRTGARIEVARSQEKASGQNRQKAQA
jgi:hypothetical protein